jgi:hypothetical protein
MIKSNKLTHLLSTMALILTASSVQSQGNAEINYAPGSGPVIRYPWKITMSSHDTIEFARHVGAKSADEPAQAEPLKGWTHFTDWVALTLTEPAMLTVEINAQPGLHYTTFSSETNTTNDLLARSWLYPASSIYEGVDPITEVGHMYNPKGNFSAAINFLKYTEDIAGEQRIRYKALLKPGEYSIAIAGINAKHCQPANTECFDGRQGYRAKFTTQATPIRVP